MLGSLLLPLLLAQAAAPTPAPTPSLGDFVQQTLSRVTVGPELSGSGVIGEHGVSTAVHAGLQVAFFDIQRIPEPRCLEQRKHERAQLGAGEGDPWDDFLLRAQQECPAVGEKVILESLFMVEGGVNFAPRGNETAFRFMAEFSPFDWQYFGFGPSTAVLFKNQGTTADVGLLLGWEATGLIRLGARNRTWHPLVEPFVRFDISVLHRDVFDDQLSAGLRFVLDL